MGRRSSVIRTPPGWSRRTEPSTDAPLGQRRWRILQGARPLAAPLDPVPAWVHTPEQFVDWLALRLAPREYREYFHDLEAIARRSCDLELLRFARRHLAAA